MNDKSQKLIFAVVVGLILCLAGSGRQRSAQAADDSRDAGARSVKNIDSGWKFAPVDDGRAGPWQEVDLPHSWNVDDTLDGDFTYRQGVGLYQKTIELDTVSGSRFFLRFEGANEKARVTINGTEVGRHLGGYTAFAFEITELVRPGANVIEVEVDNSLDREIMPLYCDFNFWGGIYRSVHLITTGKDCIAVTDHASPGVFVTQKNVTSESAQIELMARVSASVATGLNVRYQVLDASGAKVMTLDAAPIPAGDWLEARSSATIATPHLWNGVADPYLYTVRAQLYSGEEMVDAVETSLGLRHFSVDANKGLFLNGEPYRIQGVCRHQDREGKANALSDADHEEDFAIIREMGVNAVRLAHYPQADKAYSICDREGILVWAEIPFIGPTGDRTGVFLKSDAFQANIKSQMVEMVRQNYNHPSILFWGLFNELAPPGDPTELVNELNDLAHQEDPTRLTTAATFRKGELNDASDLLCWNRYHGWYYNTSQSFGAWADKQHREHPGRRLCLSEYGAGASVNQHSEFDVFVSTVGTVSSWHPQNWQAHVHEQHWPMIAERDFLWGSFLWNMFDFGVVRRREGDRPNVNDKGLVSYDRQIRKDAFYYYKANWNHEPMIHIADKRFTRRRLPAIEVKVYCNAGPVELTVNGKRVAMADEGYNVWVAKQVMLRPGVNKVTASATGVDGAVVTDSCEWKFLR